MKSIEEMMKAAQEAAATVQAQMQEAQAKLDSVEVEGVSGGGLVRIRASAKGRIKQISIDDSLIVPTDKQMLEDLLAAAFNDAREKADAASNEEMGKMTSGLPLRSEEHTSELQSLMRISYAVFCLKKKKNSQVEQREDSRTQTDH